MMSALFCLNVDDVGKLLNDNGVEEQTIECLRGEVAHAICCSVDNCVNMETAQNTQI